MRFEAYRRKRWLAQTALTTLVSMLLPAAIHAQSEEAQVNGIIPYPVDVNTLANGLKIILIPMPSDGLVAYWTIVQTGSRDEYEPGRTGFAHFFEHMMFRGTERFPSELYNRILTEFGADNNAYTSDDLTAYHVSMAAEDLERVMELESDRFTQLAYSEQDFKTEAGAVYGEYRQNRTNPLWVLFEGMLAAAFEQHTYGHTTLGYERDIAAMPTMYDYSRTFFDRYYRPENTILFIAGDIEQQNVLELARQYYGDWQPGYAAPEIIAEAEQNAERRINVSYDGRTLPIVWVAYKLDRFDPGNRTRVAADLLAALAFGPTSDAYKRLVLNEQVVEFLQAEANLNRDPGLLDIYTRVKDPTKVDYVLSVIDETVASYQRATTDPERLAALKSRLRYSFLMGLETPDSAAQRLARHIAISGGLDGMQALYEAYDTVSIDDIQQAANTYLDPQKRTVGVLTARQ